MRDDGIGNVIERAIGDGVRCERQHKHGKRRRIKLAHEGQGWQVRGEIIGRRIDGRLHIACGFIDRAVDIELNGNGGCTQRAGRGDLSDARYRAELPLKGGRNRGGHGFRIGTGLRGSDAQGGQIYRWKASNR